MIKNKTNYLTSAEVADLLGFSPDHIRKLILKGTLKGEKLGRNWIVNKKELQKVQRKRHPRTKESSIDGTSIE